MSKIAVVTDSTAYLSEDVVKKHHITVVPLSVNFGDETFKEEVDITGPDFYNKMKNTEKLPTTSQPSVGDFLTAYEALAAEYDEIISIHLSSGISGTIQAATQAAEMVENVKVSIVDSEISVSPQALLVKETVAAIGAGWDVNQIVSHLEQLKQTGRAYFIVDDLAHLHRGGRMNAAQFFIGSMLKIKPVLTFENGKIVPFEKIRTFKKAKARIFDLLHEDGSKGEPFVVSIVHANIEADAQEWAKEVKEKYPHAEVDVTNFGPVIGTHVGEGTIGMTWNVGKLVSKGE